MANILRNLHVAMVPVQYTLPSRVQIFIFCMEIWITCVLLKQRDGTTTVEYAQIKYLVLEPSFNDQNYEKDIFGVAHFICSVAYSENISIIAINFFWKNDFKTNVFVDFFYFCSKNCFDKYFFDS